MESLGIILNGAFVIQLIELIGVSGAPKIDFFTSRKNRKIKIYVSNTSDLNAFTEDASLVTWDNLKC